MRDKIKGVVNYGTATMNSSIIGDNATIVQGSAAPTSANRRADVGILTILAVEASAVNHELGLRREDGTPFHTGTVGSRSVAAVRASDQGQRPMMAAYQKLRETWDPAVVALVGIGGGVHRDVEIDDVVVATRVVYHDLRKVTPEGTRRRGSEQAAPITMTQAVNMFFTEHEPPVISVTDPAGRSRSVRLHHAPIGSGESVVADGESDILGYLASFNDKIAAIDMESGALAQAAHELSPPGCWLTIRGISDRADSAKNDDHHATASLHAAATLGALLPYLPVSLPGTED